MRLKNFLVFTVIVLFCCAVFYKVIFLDYTFFNTDFRYLHLPVRYKIYGEFFENFRPLYWTDLIRNGYPLFSYPEHSFYFPYDTIVYALAALIYGDFKEAVLKSNSFLYVFFIALNIYFFYLFARFAVKNKIICLFSALAYGMSGFFADKSGHLNEVFLTAFFPLALVYLRKSSYKNFFYLTVVLTLQLFTGRIQLFFYMTVFYFIFVLAENRSNMRYFILALVLALIICSAQLAPLAHLTLNADTPAAASASYILSGSVGLNDFIRSFGRNFSLRYYEPFRITNYVSYPVLALFLFSVFNFKFMRKNKIYFIFLAAALFFALGENNPFARFILTVPPLSYFRSPARFLYFIPFFICFISAVFFNGLNGKIKKYFIYPLFIITAVDGAFFLFNANIYYKTADFLKRPRIVSFLEKNKNAKIIVLGEPFDDIKQIHEKEPLFPNYNMLYGVKSAGGYGALPLKGQKNIKKDINLIRASGVKYALAAGFKIKRADFKNVYSDKNINIYEDIKVSPESYYIDKKSGGITPVIWKQKKYEKETRLNVNEKTLLFIPFYYPLWEFANGREKGDLKRFGEFQSVITLNDGAEHLKLVYNTRLFLVSNLITLFSSLFLAAVYLLFVRKKNRPAP